MRETRSVRFTELTAPPPQHPQPSLRIHRVPVAGRDRRPVLKGFAALRNTSPRTLLCPRVDRGKFASLCLSTATEPFNVSGTRHPKPCAGRGRAAWAEGEHIPHRLPSSLPAGAVPAAEATGRAAAALGMLGLARRPVPSRGSGMDNQPSQSAAGTARALRHGLAPSPSASFPPVGTAPAPCLKDVDRQKLK